MKRLGWWLAVALLLAASAASAAILLRGSGGPPTAPTIVDILPHSASLQTTAASGSTVTTFSCVMSDNSTCPPGGSGYVWTMANQPSFLSLNQTTGALTTTATNVPPCTPTQDNCTFPVTIGPPPVASASNCPTTPPGPAQRAGYTTLAYCLDGADPQLANVANWLQCAWATVPANATQHWFASSGGSYFQSECQSGYTWKQGTDPVTGKTDLIYTWNNNSDSTTGNTCGNTNPCSNPYEMSTAGGLSGQCRVGAPCSNPPTTDQLQWLTFPQGHYTTIRFRMTPLNQTQWTMGCCAPDYYAWGAAEQYNVFGGSATYLPLEHDYIESGFGLALLDGVPGGTNGNRYFNATAAWSAGATTISVGTCPPQIQVNQYVYNANGNYIAQVSSCSGGVLSSVLSGGAQVGGNAGDQLHDQPYGFSGYLAGNFHDGLALYQQNFPSETGLFQNQHDYGALTTMDTGNTQLQVCYYYDHNLIQLPNSLYGKQCNSPPLVRTGTGPTSDFTNRFYLNIWLGGGLSKADPLCATNTRTGDSTYTNGDANLTCAQSTNNWVGPTVYYIEYIAVWSCSNWNTYNTGAGYDSQPPCSLGIAQ